MASPAEASPASTPIPDCSNPPASSRAPVSEKFTEAKSGRTDQDSTCLNLRATSGWIQAAVLVPTGSSGQRERIAVTAGADDLGLERLAPGGIARMDVDRPCTHASDLRRGPGQRVRRDRQRRMLPGLPAPVEAGLDVDPAHPYSEDEPERLASSTTSWDDPQASVYPAPPCP